MKYGYFDDENREYVITRPDTPAPWANYLGSPEYGALISNHAGGYSFVRSGANGRLLRYVFDGRDRPGRYIYIRDNEDKDFWSASWQPVTKDPEKFAYECRHGLGYTVISARYSDIASRALWYVPKDKDWEVWHLELTNCSDHSRQLTVTGYAEFTNHGNYEQDSVNLQYSRFISRTTYLDNMILQQIHGNLIIPGREKSQNNHDVEERFFGLAGASVSSYCGDRDAFLGSYHGYGDPEGVTTGDLGNLDSYNEYSCGALSTVLELAPGESVRVSFILGAKDGDAARALLESYGQGERCRQELDELKAYWSDKLSRFQVHTPCPAFDSMINTWHAYNCFMTFIWSRAASFVYCGLRNGYGYRDTVQDIQGVIHLDPEMAADKIRFMLTGQVDHGAGLPLVKFTHNPGHEDTPEDSSYVKETGHPAYRADDALWLFPTVYKYISETGNIAFLEEVLPFANRDEGTVYEHLMRAIRFSMNHLGPHGMPAGLHADWNDCLRLGKEGESSFVAFQFYYALGIQADFARRLGKNEDAAWLEEEHARFGKLAMDLCWNEDRFIRGYTESGEVIGSRDKAEANMWLNPQSWAVISCLADEKKAGICMQTAYDRLNTAYGAILMDPPFHAEAFDGALAVIFNAGVKENSGIFSQSQGWLVLAEALLGHGERAFTYWSENAPSLQNDRAEIRRMEPYCYGQFTEGKASPHFGRSHVHWLTGTASTMMVGCVEGILGMRPDPDGLRLSPAVPAGWDHVEIEKSFRGRRLHITILNPSHRESGCTALTLNGEALSGNYIPAAALIDDNEIILTL